MELGSQNAHRRPPVPSGVPSGPPSGGTYRPSWNGAAGGSHVTASRRPLRRLRCSSPLVVAPRGPRRVRPHGAAAAEHHAAVIVETGAAVHRVVVSFYADSISGVEALQLCRAPIRRSPGSPGSARAVCALFGVGHPATASDCLGAATDPRFWAYWHVPRRPERLRRFDLLARRRRIRSSPRRRRRGLALRASANRGATFAPRTCPSPTRPPSPSRPAARRRRRGAIPARAVRAPAAAGVSGRSVSRSAGTAPATAPPAAAGRTASRRGRGPGVDDLAPRGRRRRGGRAERASARREATKRRRRRERSSRSSVRGRARGAGARDPLRPPGPSRETDRPARSLRQVLAEISQQNVNVLIAFGGGVVSFLSPCVLPIVPGLPQPHHRPVGRASVREGNVKVLPPHRVRHRAVRRRVHGGVRGPRPDHHRGR